MISNEVKADLGNSERPHIVELFELDISHIKNDDSPSIWLFCNEKNELGEQVVWRGRKFLPIPIQITGVDKKSDGPSNRPTLTVANIDGYFFGVINKYNSLRNAKLTRYRVEARHLDAENFKDGNPKANPNEYVADSYVINTAESYNKLQATFVLSLPIETDGAILPARTILASVCPFKYRGIGCGYDGHAIADIKGYALQPHEMDKDQCGKRLRDCEARFGVNGVKQFGGFPMADKVVR